MNKLWPKYKFCVILFLLCEPLKNSKNRQCRKYGWDSLRPIVRTPPIAADSAFLLPVNTYRPNPSFDLFRVFVSAAYLETLSSWEPIGHTRLEIRSVSHSANITDFLTWKMRRRPWNTLRLMWCLHQPHSHRIQGNL